MLLVQDDERSLMIGWREVRVGVGGAMGNRFCCVGVGPQANRCPRAETSHLPSSLMESRASFQSSVTAGGGGILALQVTRSPWESIGAYTVTLLSDDDSDNVDIFCLTVRVLCKL